MSEPQREALEHLAELFAVPDADIEELDKVYLQVIASQLIRLADAGFQREGRGVVLLDVPGSAKTNAPDSLVQAYYLSQAKTRSNGLIWLDGAIVQELQTYNPHAEVLVCITHSPKATFYRIKHQERVAQRRRADALHHAADGTAGVAVRISRIRTATKETGP